MPILSHILRFYPLYFGHLALLGNSLVYLLRQYDARMLDVKRIFSHDLCIKCLDFCGQLVTGGDYGFLTKPPLVGDHGLVANYLIVSLALSAAITLTKKILELFLEQEAEKNDCKESLEMSFLFFINLIFYNLFGK